MKAVQPDSFLFFINGSAAYNALAPGSISLLLSPNLPTDL
jgi:hypothetical protein